MLMPGIKYRSAMQTRKIQPATIIEETCREFGVNPADITRRSRKRGYVCARQISIWFMRKYSNLTLLECGTMFNQDHTTAIHSVKTVSDLMETDEAYRLMVTSIQNRLT